VNRKILIGAALVLLALLVLAVLAGRPRKAPVRVPPAELDDAPAVPEPIPEPEAVTVPIAEEPAADG